MAGELDSFYRAMVSAERSAFIATPAVYRLADSFAFAGDERESSASISFPQAVTETDILKLAESLKIPLEGLKQGIMQILLSDQNITDPGAKQAFAQQKQAQVKALIESFTKKLEAQLAKIAEMKAYRKHENAKTEQTQRLYGTDLSSSQEVSEQKEESIQEIENAYLIGPDDIAIA